MLCFIHVSLVHGHDSHFNNKIFLEKITEIQFRNWWFEFLESMRHI